MGTESSHQPDSQGGDSAPRLVELEEKLMFLQRALEELNSVVLVQQGELEKLAREMQAVRLLAERALDRGADTDSLDERPPHY